MKGVKEAKPMPLKDNGREPIQAARKAKGARSDRSRPNSPKRARLLARRSRMTAHQEARREQNK